MKQKILFILLLVCIGLLSFGITASAAIDGIYTYTVSDGEATITYCNTSASGAITIPSTLGGYPVTTIGDDAFYNCAGLTSVTIPDSVTTIGGYTFYYCTSLTSITIPDSVTTIGNSAFRNCTSLTSITVPDSVTTIGDLAFYECESLTSVIIGNSVTSIGNCAFAFCYNLTSITIPDSVTTIDRDAFGWCYNVTDIYYNGTEEEWNNISNGQFDPLFTDVTIHCIRTGRCGANLTWTLNLEGTLTISGAGAMTSWLSESSVPWYSNRSDIKSVVIDNGVTSIGERAFYSCTSLTSITIPDSVTTIGDAAFANCASLTSIIIPDSVTSIGDSAFANCTSLTSIIIPDSVTSIRRFMFSFCASLTEVTIPDSVISIGFCAFDFCTSLTSISIPDSVTSIDDEAFYECSSLTSVTIGNSVTTIGNYAFAYCDGLTSVTIGNSVTTIGDAAFANCASLTDVYYAGSKEQWNAISIDSFNTPLTSATIHYNQGPEVTINYYAIGGSNAPENQTGRGEVILSNMVPNRLGYTFLGWATTADAVSAQYQPGDSIILGNENINLYAVWEKTTYLTAQKKQISGMQMILVSTTNIPNGSQIVLACYQDEILSYVEPVLKLEAEDDYYFLPNGAYDTVKVLVFDSFGNCCPITVPEILD